MTRNVIKISAWKKQHPEHEPKLLLLHASETVSNINGHADQCQCDSCRIVRIKGSLGKINELMKAVRNDARRQRKKQKIM